MLVDQTVTSLEMTSPAHLRPGRAPPAAVDVEDTAELRLIRGIHDRVTAPHHWSSLEWTEDRWRELLSRPGVRTWIARVGLDAVGIVQLEAQPRGNVEITASSTSGAGSARSPDATAGGSALRLFTRDKAVKGRQ